ncbi:MULTISPECIES: hydroxymethylglutaryl-CoA lyase [Thalassobaculum]|uniref:Hydroxymethylglutaryl-CoA lyase n=2 Tax=Thalassobaculum TaxID=526215 RepID=A0A8G2BHW8_9PROT|nr:MULTISPECIES: hydroxymethylglutaryl-CoA lyase [Thalassobaculum]SDF41698.1 hydroxymethylglutaryl-CoA lyase [Thalassobaculum litoreum DSM 18839]
MTQVRKVEVTDVGPRDGLQAEKRLIPAAEKIALINRLIDAGVPRIEATSFVSPKAVPQLADAAEVMAGIDRSKGAIIATLVPNGRGAIRAAECGVDEMVVFVSASESHNKKNVNRSVEESLKGFEEVAKIAGDAKIPVHGAIATAFGCPFEGNVAPERLAMIAKRFQDMGFVGMTFGDTTGMATPPTVRAGVAAVREAAPKLTMGLHFHNTRGIGLANVMVGLDEGIDKYESSFGGTGGCPFAPGATGNICTEDLVYLLHEMGIETGIDLRKLMAIGCDVETVVGHPLPGQVMKAGQRLDLHDMDAVRTAEG